MKKVVKFGGSSLADAAQFKKVAAIIRDDPTRLYVVPSAPGKRFSGDEKVTDLLYRCYDKAAAGEDFRPTLSMIRGRYDDIIVGLGLKNFTLEPDFAEIEKSLAENPERDYTASRGEYLNSKIMAEFIGFEFVDAADVVVFDEDGGLSLRRTNKAMANCLQNLEHVVIPGFYGRGVDGKIKTFSRGGSDITGSIVAGAMKVDVYENWTDVSGFLVADPRIVENPVAINTITYRELRELSYMGASVLHEDAVFPVRAAGIPINIRNTNSPGDNGTLIAATLPPDVKRGAVTGIAGRKGFSSIRVEKSQMNGETGFGARLLYLFSRNGIPFEHCPTGIDTISVVVNSLMFEAKRDEILRGIKNELAPDFITIEKGLAMIAVVGEGMVSVKGVAAKIFTALAGAGVNIRMIDQGSDEMNIIIGVDEADYEKSINALYGAMIEH